MGQANAQVGGGQIGLCPVWPFDQTEAICSIVGEIFVKARIEKFFRNIEPIKIKVI